MVSRYNIEVKIPNNLDSRKNEWNNWPVFGWLIAGSVLIITRALFAIKAPVGWFGYDFGFYLFSAKQNTKNLPDMLAGIFGGYNNPLFVLGNWLGINPETLTQTSYFIASLLLAVSLIYYFGLRNRSSVWAILLLSGSIIQIEAYSMFLWKNLTALPFMILGFAAFNKKLWTLLGFCLAVLLVTHRTTAIIFVLSFGWVILGKLVKNKSFKKFWLWGIIWLGATGLLLAHYWPAIMSLINHENLSVQDGVFLNGVNKWKLIWPELLLGLGGLWVTRKNKWNTITGLVLMSGAWVLFKLPFYNRIYIFLSLGLMMLGAMFLEYLYANGGKLAKIITVAATIGIIVLGLKYTWYKQPLISYEEVKEIAEFKNPDSIPFVLATSPDDAPWLLGYIENARLGAPGLMENPHTKEEWEEFWANQNQARFLSVYPRPLFFYERSYKVSGWVEGCKERVSLNFSKYTCE